MDEEVEVIWHRTVSVHEKVLFVGDVQQNGDNHFGGGRRCEVGVALIATDRDEIDVLAQIIFLRKARGFAFDWHGLLSG